LPKCEGVGSAFEHCLHYLGTKEGYFTCQDSDLFLSVSMLDFVDMKITIIIFLNIMDFLAAIVDIKF